MRLILLALLALPGCTRAIVSTPPAACSKLVPAEWADGVSGAALPAADTTDDWRKAFVDQSGQLSKANSRTKAAISIFTDCETRANASRP